LAAGDQAARFETSNKPDNSRSVETQLWLAGLVIVQGYARLVRPAQRYHAQSDVFSPGQVGVAADEDSFDKTSQGAFGFADVLPGQSCWC
jgi:hypothetical protein